MKTMLAGLALALGLSSAAIAMDDPMMNTYENTVVVTTAEGVVTKLLFGADKSYTSMTGETTVKGTWEITADGTQICYTQVEPAPAPEATQPGCAPFLGLKNVGDTWEQADVNGAMVTVTLTAGR